MYALAEKAALRRYPEERADRSWDNVGLLLGNSESTTQHQRPIALVTNDLTWQVGEDAIKQGASVIVSYRAYCERPFPLPPGPKKGPPALSACRA